MNRRQLLGSLGMSLGAVEVARGAVQVARQGPAQEKATLPLDEFQPKSMLHVAETKVARSRFPVIDMHSHLSRAPRDGNGAVRMLASPTEILGVMDRKNLRAMVHLTGSFGESLAQNIRELQ